MKTLRSVCQRAADLSGFEREPVRRAPTGARWAEDGADRIAFLFGPQLAFLVHRDTEVIEMRGPFVTHLGEDGQVRAMMLREATTTFARLPLPAEISRWN
jgi:hypothetical protein